MERINYWDSYGVFCIAIQLKIEDLDLRYEKAIRLYEEFLDSYFNTIVNFSELELINRFLKEYEYID